MLVIMGQMEQPSEIFDFLYLVGLCNEELLIVCEFVSSDEMALKPLWKPWDANITDQAARIK